MEKINCKQCGHRWIPRTEDPLECPSCKSRKWKQKKQNKKIGLE